MAHNIVVCCRMQERSKPTNPGQGAFVAPDCSTLNELLPAFEFHELIACGGMGAVYRAQQISLSRDVAIKVLPPELSAIEAFAESFKIEARAMAKLSHPNLIGIYNFGEVAGMLYLVMEFIDGNALYRSISGKKVEPLQAAEIVKGVAHGLGEAHQHDLLHRDIKPANILITRKLKPVLGDFGLAVSSDNVGSGMNMGTPGYVAPEVLRDFSLASTTSDVYSLGVILHELVTGVKPSPEEPPNLSLVPSLYGLHDLINRALADDPGERPADGAAFADELETWLVSARNAGPSLLTAAPGPGRTSTTASRTPAMLASRSTRGLPIPLLILAGLGIIAFAIFMLSGGKDSRDAPGQAQNQPNTKSSPPTSSGSEPSPVRSPLPSPLQLEAHKSGMRNSLINAANELVVARQRNVVEFQREVVGRENDWSPYLSLIDHGRGLLPRYLSPETKVSLDPGMIDLLNRYAFDHQGQLEYRHFNMVKQLHQESIEILRRENVLPGNRLFESEIHWIEWLGASPFKVLARPPDGEWVLRFGPADARAVHLIFERGSTVRVLDRKSVV